jgi:hypothetical protein
MASRCVSSTAAALVSNGPLLGPLEGSPGRGTPSSTNRALASDRPRHRTLQTWGVGWSWVCRHPVVGQPAHPQLHSTSSGGAGDGCVQA